MGKLSEKFGGVVGGRGFSKVRVFGYKVRNFAFFFYSKNSGRKRCPTLSIYKSFHYYKAHGWLYVHVNDQRITEF